eukprot:CAMPEP_0197611340 /NCGR_PEP_ID=MMETSP1326-20131121/55165_1 /TAXON_ID=1155430 /ORGANISM="Genus nov. species nov., Strain RCC2288" /LENGTH=36 /DNA_ID= /DNA_START= /DNA_END= /DNA_ORIENTATION=
MSILYAWDAAADVFPQRPDAHTWVGAGVHRVIDDLA